MHPGIFSLHFPIILIEACFLITLSVKHIKRGCHILAGNGSQDPVLGGEKVLREVGTAGPGMGGEPSGDQARTVIVVTRSQGWVLTVLLYIYLILKMFSLSPYPVRGQKEQTQDKGDGRKEIF